MRILVCVYLVLLASASAVVADDSKVCMEASELEAAIVDWYNETLVSWEGSDTYVWASGVGGTWTVVQYTSNGSKEFACVIGQGYNWGPGVDKDVLLASADG